jgi:peptidoglycan LD-endopeptidase CwlK
MFRFSAASYEQLAGVRPELVAVATLALSRSEIDFGITDGMRTIEEQKELVAKGASWTMNSKHLKGLAIDVIAYVNGKGRWEGPLYEKIAEAFRSASADLDVPIVWGGSWSQKDGCHFELTPPPPLPPTVAA